MRKAWLALFTALVFVFLVIPGMAEDEGSNTLDGQPILGPGGTYDGSAEEHIVGPGGTYDGSGEEHIVGPGGINPDDTPVIGPGGIYDPDSIYPAIHSYMYVITSGGHLNVRSYPDTDASIIGRLEYGQQILVTGLSDYSEWARVLYNEEKGYVQKHYLSSTPPGPLPTETPYYPPYYPTSPPYYPPYEPTSAPYYPPYPTTPPYTSETTITDLNEVYDTMVIDVNQPFTVTAHPAQMSETVQLYWAPSQDASVIRYCNEGETFTAYAYNNEWLMVRDDTYGFFGYMLRTQAY